MGNMDNIGNIGDMDNMENTENIALNGMLVIDLTRVVSGPTAALALADLGARIIKVETPGRGDDSRQWGPFVNGESSYYVSLNRNKEGITLNLKHPKGKEMLWGLIKKADVLIENYKPGVMDRLGFGYGEVRKANPRIVYASVSGFGQYGPYKERAGYDIIAQAMSGIMAITGFDGGPPVKVNAYIGDVLGGLNAAIGILAAYANVLKTGKGQRVDVSLVDSLVASMTVMNHIYLAGGNVPERIGNDDSMSAPYGVFECKNGYVAIGIANDTLWRKLCDAMGKPGLASDPEFARNADRVKNKRAVFSILGEWLMRHTDEEIAGELVPKGIPAGPVYNIDRISKDAHVAKAREMFVTHRHPNKGVQTVTGCPIKLSGTPFGIRSPAPVLGEHNAAILKEFFGCSETDVDKLRADGVI